jgi:hypothetical protein
MTAHGMIQETLDQCFPARGLRLFNLRIGRWKASRIPHPAPKSPFSSLNGRPPSTRFLPQHCHAVVNHLPNPDVTQR